MRALYRFLMNVLLAVSLGAFIFYGPDISLLATDHVAAGQRGGGGGGARGGMGSRGAGFRGNNPGVMRSNGARFNGASRYQGHVGKYGVRPNTLYRGYAPNRYGYRGWSNWAYPSVWNYGSDYYDGGDSGYYTPNYDGGYSFYYTPYYDGGYSFYYTPYYDGGYSGYYTPYSDGGNSGYYIPYYDTWDYDQTPQYYPPDTQGYPSEYPSPNYTRPSPQAYPNGGFPNGMSPASPGVDNTRSNTPSNNAPVQSQSKNKMPDIIVYPPAPSRTNAIPSDNTRKPPQEDLVRTISLKIDIAGFSIPLEVQNDDIIARKVLEVITGSGGTYYIVPCNQDSKPTQIPSGSSKGEWQWMQPAEDQVCGYWLWEVAGKQGASDTIDSRSSASVSYLPEGVSINITGGIGEPVIVKLQEADGTVTSRAVPMDTLPSIMTLPLKSGEFIELEVVKPGEPNTKSPDASSNGRWQWITPTEISQGYWLWIPPVKV